MGIPEVHDDSVPEDSQASTLVSCNMQHSPRQSTKPRSYRVVADRKIHPRSQYQILWSVRAVMVISLGYAAEPLLLHTFVMFVIYRIDLVWESGPIEQHSSAVPIL